MRQKTLKTKNERTKSKVPLQRFDQLWSSSGLGTVKRNCPASETRDVHPLTVRARMNYEQWTVFCFYEPPTLIFNPLLQWTLNISIYFITLQLKWTVILTINISPCFILNTNQVMKMYFLYFCIFCTFVRFLLFIIFIFFICFFLLF